MDRELGHPHVPLAGEAWEAFITDAVYPDHQAKARDDYRNCAMPARDTVRELYRQNHQHQTFEFVREKKREFLSFRRLRMSIFEALDQLDTRIDDTDSGSELSQFQHMLQTSEAIRAVGHPDWFVLTGLIHDLGKLLSLFGEPPWAVVGDTFPVGCQFSDRVVYSEYFADNPDARDPRYNTPLGIYRAGCGLRNVAISWGHDEYLYHRMKGFLPEPALYMIRFHSFYAWHREGEYDALCDDHDRQMLHWVRAFNPFDLYTKSPSPPDWNSLRSYYERLVIKYLPPVLDW